MASTDRTLPPRRIPRAVREEQLLDIAEELFALHGFDAVSIEQVAQRAGITRPVVYDHFGSKEGLYLACVRRAATGVGAALATAVGGARDPSDMLLRGGDAFFEILERQPRRWSILFSVRAPLQGDFAERIAELRSATIAPIIAILSARLPGIEPERVEAVAHAVAGAAEQLGRWWLAHPDIPRAQVAEVFRDLTWTGISGLAAESRGRGERPDGRPAAPAANVR